MNDLYSEDTGEPVLEQAAVQISVEDRADIAIAEGLIALKDTAGWRYVEEWLLNQIEVGKDKLIDLQGDALTRTQQTVRAYSNLLGEIEHRIEYAKSITGPK